MDEKINKIRPFLKWAGNKFRILDPILSRLPTAQRFIEPFAGSAALFLNTNYEKYWINDLNPDLINLYKTLKRERGDFIDYCETLFTPKNNTEKQYYRMRDRFNAETDIEKRAALFIYLNRHGYNGLCRYNLKGIFNVPFGRYKQPRCPADAMLAFAKKSKRATFTCKPFEAVLAKSNSNDMIYCDPPYAPLSKTASFTSYHGSGFTLADQQRLADAAEKSNASVMISNHDLPLTRKLYSEADLVHLKVPRSINCQGHKRKAVKELLALYY